MIIIALILFLIYNIYYIYSKGLPENLSSTYYDLKWLFPVTIGICGVLTMITWLSALEGSPWQFTGFLCPLAIFFMCAAPDFKKFGLIYKVHSIGSYIGALMAVLSIIFIFNSWPVLIIVFLGISLIALGLKSWKRCYIYWIELWIFLSIFIVLLLKIL